MKKITIPALDQLDLPAHEVDLIARHSTQVTIKAGERLARQGEFPRQMFLLLEGSAEVVRSGEMIATVGPLEFAGEMALARKDLYRSADVYALEDTTALVFSTREWWSLETKAPRFAELVGSTVAARLATV